MDPFADPHGAPAINTHGGGWDRDLETDDGSGLPPNRIQRHDNFSHFKDETSKMSQASHTASCSGDSLVHIGETYIINTAVLVVAGLEDQAICDVDGHIHSVQTL